MKQIDTSPAQRINALRGNTYFTDLPEPLLKEIVPYIQLREYQRGDILFWEADPCDGLHFIESGSAKIFRLSTQGRQYIVRILQEGDTFAEVPAFDGGTNPVNVEALETSRVWVINGDKLRSLVTLYPAFTKKVLENFGEMLRSLVRMASEMAFYQVTHRLARLINEQQSNESPPHFTQEQLAAQLGTVREVVARSLKELERSGAIRIEDRRIYIAENQVLQQWTDPN
jgi:CRP-like cAMP-binding protein